MAGIYFHIPFCKKKCSYCDFYSNTNFGILRLLINAEIKELTLRKDYLKNEIVHTIYFGGGTPSILTIDQIDLLLKAVYDNFIVSTECEITFECSPDDLTIEYLTGLRKTGVNRISIGVQSFNDQVLKFLSRRHSASQASKVIDYAIKAGFDNISVDIMFGIPRMTFESYKETLSKLINSGIQHISAYQLTFEERTLLYKRLISNKIQEISEEESIQQFDFTIDTLEKHGFLPYEVSNYAKAGFESKHNCNYWDNVNYLGIGPSAHSYDGNTRQWNVSNTVLYCKGVDMKDGYYDREFLTENDRYNEYIMTKLRTARGVSENYVMNTFNKKIQQHFLKQLNELIDEGFINCNEDSLALKRKGIFILNLLINRLCLV